MSTSDERQRRRGMSDQKSPHRGPQLARNRETKRHDVREARSEEGMSDNKINDQAT